MSPSWYLMQFCLRAQPQVPLGMTFSALTTTSYCLAAVWSSQPEFQFSYLPEFMDKCALDLDWP